MDDRLLQEVLVERDPTGYEMLVGCILLNQTSRKQVDEVWEKLLDNWTSYDIIATTEHSSLRDKLLHLLRPLGLQNRRLGTLQRFCMRWATLSDEARDDAVMELDIPGCGEYARDSWYIFKNREWPPQETHDKELKKWLALYGVDKLKTYVPTR